MLHFQGCVPYFHTLYFLSRTDAAVFVAPVEEGISDGRCRSLWEGAIDATKDKAIGDEEKKNVKDNIKFVHTQ